MITSMVDWWGKARRVLLGAPPAAHAFDSDPKPLDRVISAMLNADGRVTRATALGVAPVLRGRNLICSISTLPLVVCDLKRNRVDNSLLRQIDPDVPNVVTISQTVEDLMFEGISWWRVTARDFDGFPVAARHLDVNSVSFNPPTGATNPLPSGGDPRGATGGTGARRGVYVDGEFVSAPDVIRFDSPNPGLLRACGKSIQRLSIYEAAAGLYARNSRPLDYFRPAADSMEPTGDERDEFLARWEAMRRRHTTGYVPAWAEYVTVDSPSPRDLQLVELMARATLDVANAMSIDPEDLGISTTSRTYFNAVDRRQSRVNEVYAGFMRAITDRLTMGDVTRRGYYVQFDLDQYLQADPVSRVQFYQGLYATDAITPEEIRTKEGLPVNPDGTLGKPEPVAAPPAADPAADPDATGVDAHKRAALTFDGPADITLDATGTVGFAVDTERRQISGLAVPYGKVAEKYGMKFRFKRGAITWTDVARVKHYRDHITPVGKALELKDGRAGLAARLSVARGAAGDELLQLAEDGVYDGLSVGVDFSMDPEVGDVVLGRDGVYDVVRATLREVTTTPVPAFDDARVTRVVASRGGNMPCPNCGHVHDAAAPCATPAPTPAVTLPAAPDLTTNVMASFMAAVAADPARFGIGPALAPPPPVAPERPAVVDPTRTGFSTEVNEPAPYVFDVKGNLRAGSHDFSSDLHAAEQGDLAARDRSLSWIGAQFDATNTTDTAGLNPNRQRPDMYVDQRSYRYPVWEAISKGSLSDITPFVFPKFNTASGLVGAHTEGTEPTVGDITVTTQTVTPAAISGKAEINREVWDQGGNPQISNLIWRQMVKGWYEALEAKAVALLDAATPAQLATFTAGGGTNKATLVAQLTAGLASLQFVRGGFSMDKGFAQIDLYKDLIAATDTAGRPIYPALGPQNAYGTVGNRLGAIEVAPGVPMYPAWALAASGSVAASSYLFDSDSVHGWASAPQRLDFNYQVKSVFIGIWGYSATAISDINGVREITYDPVP